MKLLKMIILSMFLATAPFIESKSMTGKSLVKLTGFMIWGMGLSYFFKNLGVLYKKIEQHFEKYSEGKDTQILIDAKTIPLALFNLIAPLALMYIGDQITNTSIC